jgi:tetratricopeptide (TPR) repeat protein
MSRSGVERALGPLAAAALVAALTSGAAPAAAQGLPGGPAPALTPPVQESLLRLQEGWLQWTGALYGGDPERAQQVVDDLLATARHLGMRRLPDLAAGAQALAVEAAREGEGERAALALEAAERLDPGRPETAFAAAEVARRSGAWTRMVAEQARGYLRLPRMGLEGRLALLDLFLWALASLLVAGGLLVALLMGVRGPALVRDLGGFLGRRLPGLPGSATALVVALLLLWPLALPSGVLWLTLYWSLLLWGYAGAAERAALALSWLLVAATPLALGEVRERVALALSPPIRAMESVARDRLYGGLFTDLGILPEALPDEPAVDHFLADLEVRLDQWDEARRRYQEVLEAEPENVAALVNLGAYYFNRGDYGNSVTFFQRAAALVPEDSLERAVVHFDLSLAYAESYLFDEQREALLEARRIDDLRVTRWLRRSERERIVLLEGGIGRRAAIEDALRAEWLPPSEVSPPLRVLRRARPAILVGLLAAVAVAFHTVRGGRRPARLERSRPGRLAAALVPGLPSLAAGRGGRALAALWLASALALTFLAGHGGLGYAVPWRHQPGGWFLPALAATALALFLALRGARAARAGS